MGFVREQVRERVVEKVVKNNRESLSRFPFAIVENLIKASYLVSFQPRGFRLR